jgi:hypothetical protein
MLDGKLCVGRQKRVDEAHASAGRVALEAKVK